MKNFHDISSCPKLSNMGVIVAAVIIIAGCTGNPPTEQMAVSKLAVNAATSAGGNEFAPLPMRSAMEKMDAAEYAMGQEDYPLAKQLAEQAQVDAQLAAAAARSAKAQKAAGALQEGNRVLRQEINRSSGL
jgi:hypothetical protein